MLGDERENSSKRMPLLNILLTIKELLAEDGFRWRTASKQEYSWLLNQNYGVIYFKKICNKQQGKEVCNKLQGWETIILVKYNISLKLLVDY